MYSKPLTITTITINSYNHEELISFYIELGIGITKFVNDKNKINFYYKIEGIKYIINPVEDILQSTKNLSLSFAVADLDGYYNILLEIGAEVVEKIQLEDEYKIIIKDPGGNFIELYER